MTPRENINKAVFNVVNNMKDNISKNLVEAMQKGVISVEQDEIDKVIMLVKQTLDASYHNSNKTLMKCVDNALQNNEKKV